MKKIIVYDVGIPGFKKNRILNAQYAASFPGASVIPKVRTLVEQRGWKMMTGDVFLKESPTFSRAVCWSNEATPMLRPIVERGVEPVLLSSGESPNVAWDFYHELVTRSKPFRHAVLFHGVKERCSATHLHQFYWPCDGRTMSEGAAWGKRDMLCMVVSSRSKIGANWSNPLSRLAIPKRWAESKIRDLRDPFLKVEDLCENRLAGIEAFAGYGSFRLFGRGWASALQHWSRFRHLHFEKPPLECNNKLKVMEGYRFSLCFENCSFPGYVTEKIFDCFFAGCVPVYMGAPDITDFVPSNCFIDFREFRSFQELWESLADISFKQWNVYRDAMRSYLAADRYTPFKDSVVAEKILNWMTEE